MARERGLQAPKLHPLPGFELEEVDGDRLAAEESVDRARLRFGARGEARLDFAALTECDLPEPRLESLSTRGARLNEVRLSDVDIVTWHSRDASWRDVELGPGRVGSLDLSDGEVRAATVSGLRIGYIDLRAATLSDVLFEGCSIGSLDLPSASLTRVRFVDCTVDELDLRMAQCSSVDIRGLTIGARFEISGRAGRPPLEGLYATPEQAAELAPVLARTVGLTLL
ncbi:pentapeptide repeat-containing protein [Herbiconiux sp. L3-i23]|uniref:pentapeptide repeat-containing protein n=1 Tax=Herbiconiux sp. L3-i23 TaxID=2905871 RepID=UPI00204A757D|nr:hypothetical protein [Herbiconiux sp. L3-i23]BDI24097.1 hypothetical protein L3i23_28730 [Herbiconiux sp. L3-i23]